MVFPNRGPQLNTPDSSNADLFHPFAKQRQASLSSHTTQDVSGPETRRPLSHLYQPSQSLVPDLSKLYTSSRRTMGSTPKRWVMRPLMPKLEKTDLRAMFSPDSETYSPDKSSIPSQDRDPLKFNFDDISVARFQSSVTVTTTNGDGVKDVVVQARQVAVSEEGSTSEDWHQSSPSSPGTPSSTDSRVGFYSFVEDPLSPEAEKNEAYMVSPERQAKLSTLKERNSFKLQTYMDDRKPVKLFEESNGDSMYKVEDNLAEENNEENPDRLEIIRSQAPKKNTAFKEQWSAQENLDLRNSPHRLVEGFSLCYSPLNTKPAQPEAEPGTIDHQQIDFSAARKQFLLMEQSKENPFRHSPQQMPPSPKLRGRTPPAEFGLFTREVSQDKNLKEEFSENELPLTKEKNIKTTVTVFEDPEESLEISLIDDLDSGRGTKKVDFISNGSLSSEPSMLDIKSDLSVASTSETPIEREIRIAQEREEDLRRARGIFRPVTTEMVEIKTKPILTQSSSEFKPVKVKETNRVSFLIQREMDRDSDGGNLHDLEEKSKTFSSQSDQVDIKSLRTSSSQSPLCSSVTVEESCIAQKPALEEQRGVPDTNEALSPCCPHRHQDETLIQRSPTQNESTSILDRTVKTHLYFKEPPAERPNDDFPSTNQPFWIAEYKEKGARRTFSSMSSPGSPASPLGSKRSIAARRSYLHSTNEWPRQLNVSDTIRKEIEEDLRREKELQQLRETSNQSLSADADFSDPTATSVTSKELSAPNDDDHTTLISSQENFVEVDSAVLERSTPRTTYSHAWSLDSVPATHTSLAGSSSRLSSVSIVTPQPWSSQKTSYPAVPKAASILSASPRPEASSSPSQKGLTETLLEDFEERRIRLKLEESSYAGIQPIDTINNEVVEATRVTRHKSSRALRWEAGVYANEENN